jgi:hypothetical protein
LFCFFWRFSLKFTKSVQIQFPLFWHCNVTSASVTPVRVSRARARQCRWLVKEASASNWPRRRPVGPNIIVFVLLKSWISFKSILKISYANLRNKYFCEQAPRRICTAARKVRRLADAWWTQLVACRARLASVQVTIAIVVGACTRV